MAGLAASGDGAAFGSAAFAAAQNIPSNATVNENLPVEPRPRFKPEIAFMTVLELVGIRRLLRRQEPSAGFDIALGGTKAGGRARTNIPQEPLLPSLSCSTVGRGLAPILSGEALLPLANADCSGNFHFPHAFRRQGADSSFYGSWGTWVSRES